MEVKSKFSEFPGARDQAMVNMKWETTKEDIVAASRMQWEHVQNGGTDFMHPGGDQIQAVPFQAPRDEERWPPLDPEILDVFVYWPTPPEDYVGKQPAMLYLHGAACAKDTQGLEVMGYDCWWTNSAPPELIIIIPQCNSRNRRPWLTNTVKNTLVYIAEQVIENGADPDRVYVAGFSMGGIGTWELALDSAEGSAPFAAAVPVSGMVMNNHRLPSAVTYPLWVFHGSNDIVNPCDRDDEAINALLAAGANQGPVETLRYTRYDWSPGEIDTVSGQPTPFQTGHCAMEQAFADKELWTWLLRQRRDRRRSENPVMILPDGTKVPGGRRQGELDERLPAVQERLADLAVLSRQHALNGGTELVVHGRQPIPRIRMQGEPDPTRKPPLDPEPLDFFFVWPPAPGDPKEKRPALLFLHGGYACQDEGGLAGLADNCWWLPRVPDDMVVIIPQAKSRKRHWLLRTVKATIMYVIDKLIAKFNVDPYRVYVTGLSMGGTAAWEFALSSVEGKMPFAAAIPVTPYVMSIKRARLLADFPIWLFYGSNEWDSLVSRVDEAVSTAIEAGANKGKDQTLQCTKYSYSPDTEDPSLPSCMNLGHGTYLHAYGEPDLWRWVLSHRKRFYFDGVVAAG